MGRRWPHRPFWKDTRFPPTPHHAAGPPSPVFLDVISGGGAWPQSPRGHQQTLGYAERQVWETFIRRGVRHSGHCGWGHWNLPDVSVLIVRHRGAFPLELNAREGAGHLVGPQAGAKGSRGCWRTFQILPGDLAEGLLRVEPALQGRELLLAARCSEGRRVWAERSP